MVKFTRICVVQTAYGLYKQFIRCKGHSKWQNIRHTKGAKDAERSMTYQEYAKKIKLAAIEGKSTKPNLNLKLSQIIEEAKRKSIPLGTINGVLEKIENSKMKTQSETLDFRGPGNAQFVLRLMSDNVKQLRMTLNTIFKKHSSVVNDGKSLSLFHHQAFVLTEMKVDLDTATNDAIVAGAEDVEEVKEDRKLLRFISHPSTLPKVTNQLKNLNYKIITSDEEFVPKSTVSLDEKDLEKIDVLCEKLNALEEVVTIYHNIDLPVSESETMNMKAKR